MSATFRRAIFESTAAIIREQRLQRPADSHIFDEIAKAFADEYERHNPLFDRRYFLEAVGVER